MMIDKKQHPELGLKVNRFVYVIKEMIEVVGADATMEWIYDQINGVINSDNMILS